MMKTQFYILLSQRSKFGYETYGQYMLGDDRKTAYEIFEKLKGNDDLRNEALLHFDFMETVDEIPVKIKTLSCTLEEYATNCKTIAKETFKRLNLEDA